MASTDEPLRVLHVISGDLWAGAEVQACTLLKQLHPRCVLRVVLMNPGRLHDECVAAGIDVTVYDERHLSGWQIFKALRRSIKAFRPHVIHTHRKKENILGALAGWSAGCRCSVRTSHGAPEFQTRGLRRMLSAVDQFVARYLQRAVIAVSDDLANQLARRLPERRIRTIHNGIEVEALATEARAPTPFEPGKRHIGIVGRLESVKRVDLFITMIPLLERYLPGTSFQCHVIGDGRERANLEALARQQSVAEKIRFHGHRSDIPRCLQNLDLLVMCSDHEGTPMVVLEALALGTPVLAHRVGGLVEILSAYPSLLVDDHSAEGYARALARVLPELERWDVQLEKRYRARQNAERTLALYRDVTQS